VAAFAGMSKALGTPRIRAWILSNLWWIIPLFMLMQIALFVWDRVEERRQHGASNTASHGTALPRRP